MWISKKFEVIYAQGNLLASPHPQNDPKSCEKSLRKEKLDQYSFI